MEHGHIHMPLKDWLFLKKYFDNIDRYILNVSMTGEEVTIDLYDEKVRSFLLDYRSMIVRKGTADQESFNDAGLRMNHIYSSYIRPLLKEGKLQ